MGATWWTPQSPPRLLPWSFATFAADVRSDVVVVDVGAIGLLTILRVDGDASGVDENGATFVARKGVVDVVEVDADLGLASDAIEVVEVDSIRAVFDVVVADAISVVAGDAEGAAALGAISAAAEAVGVVEADAIFSAVEDAVAAVAADAISAAGGGVVGAVAADAGATTAGGAIAVDLSTPQLSTK